MHRSNQKMPTTTTHKGESIKASYLELIIGPMYSGKTSKIIEIYKQYTFCNIPAMVINHVWDTRYDATLLSSHNQVKIGCTQTMRLMDVFAQATDKDMPVVLINEGQFFDDLYEFVDGLLRDAAAKGHSKKIYVSGLDGDFERKRFGHILDLIPLCDRVYKLTSICSQCRNGTEGIFSMRITSEKEQTVVGSDNYIPVCRACYENAHKG